MKLNTITITWQAKNYCLLKLSSSDNNEYMYIITDDYMSKYQVTKYLIIQINDMLGKT